tara:strand:+ start:332 stop:793 length:462 start_codon:yes stop_codon:yes gene_type:complete
MGNLINYEFYKKFHEHLPIVCVDIVLKTTNGEFLMLKRKDHPVKDMWWFVGGRVFKNERLERAVRRKVREETGLEIRNIQKIISGYEIFFHEDPFGHGNGTHAVVSCFKAEIENLKKIRINNYSSEYKLFEFYEGNWHPYLIQCLKNSGIQLK